MFPILLISRDKKQIRTYVRDFIKEHEIPSFLCFEFSKEKSSITIDQIRQIAGILSRTGPRKLIVVYDFETAKKEAQNAFLKTLEEKADAAYFIVVVTDESVLVSTIVSRCKKIALKGDTYESDQSFNPDRSLAQLLGSYQGIEKKKEAALTLCDDLIVTFRAKMRHDATLAAFLKEILTVRNLIDKNNLNPQLAIDHLLIWYSQHISAA